MAQSTLPIQLGRYLLTERIGRGGMAEVFRAIAQGAMGFEKRLVIKRLLPELANDRESLRMFVTEAKLVCGLEHPNIVQVIELGEADGQYYMVMEHVDGIDAWILLKTLALRQQRLPANLALFVIAEVLKGLDHAHEARGPDGELLGVVHRDISPSNIMISCYGDVKLGDFGIARVKQETTTHSGVLRGKYGYMAPEQLTGLTVDRRSDIFSAGTVLGELLLGRRLFRGSNDFDTMRRVINVQLDLVDEFASVFPTEVIRIVRTALQRNVDDRYPTALAFRQDIVDHLAVTQPHVTHETLAAFIGRHVVPHTDLVASADTAGEEQPAARADRPRSSTSTVRLTFTAGIDPEAVPDPDVATEGTTAVEFDFGVGDVEERFAGERPPTETADPFVPDVEQPGIEPADSQKKTLTETPALQVAGMLASTGFTIEAGPDLLGDLSERAVTRVVFSLFRRRDTGLLVLTGDEVAGETAEHLRWLAAKTSSDRTGHGPPAGSRSCQVYFEHGTPAVVSAERREEEAVARLLAEGLLTRGAIESAMREHPGWPPMSALLRAETVSPLQVSRFVSLVVNWRVLDAFSWTAGEFAFYRGLRCPIDTFPTGSHAMQFIVDGVRSMEDRAIESQLRRLGASKLNANPAPPEPPSELAIHPEAARIYEQLSAGRAADRVLADLQATAGARLVREAVHLLYECAFLRVV